MRSIFLLSDGQANLGVIDQQTLQRTTASLLDSSGSIKLYTFGFGNDYDAVLLQGLAASGSGMAFHITDPDSIPTSMATALGGLLTLTAQSVQLTIRAQVRWDLRAMPEALSYFVCSSAVTSRSGKAAQTLAAGGSAPETCSYRLSHRPAGGRQHHSADW